ncbi:MAG: hypothetical protein Q9216_005101 [Gyalolechia sp. 2 TL-2023]
MDRRGQLEDAIQSSEQIKQLLNGLYGGRTSSGEQAFDVEHGVYLEKLSQLNQTPLVSEQMLDIYVDQLKVATIDVPVLFVAATRDDALPPSMSKSMDRHIPNLTRKSVHTHHWALWEKPEEVNQIIQDWLKSTAPRRASHL